LATDWTPTLRWRTLLHIPCALVLTGVSTREDLACAPLEQLPQWVLSDLSELLGDPAENLLIHTP
jgi:ribonucleotide monophosphatase NagD (HAD superfamily)